MSLSSSDILAMPADIRLNTQVASFSEGVQDTPESTTAWASLPSRLLQKVTHNGTVRNMA